MPFKSASFYLMAMLYLFLILLAPPPTILQMSVESRVVAAIRPLDSIRSSPSNYVPLKVPYENKGGHEVAPNGFGSHIVESCLPKGFRRSSAPSHYVNGHTFGSELCSSSKGKNSP
ncbi:hypothetical protein D8674_000942 [Pyrus ussuriensis x Pyrus communis]|uniref:Transmembrane protein n=1 Tax=Pyrus ussuriensis x Pyrus communis TaxID=2448454 RepID=A0A5N5F9W7_9ROSA|nr:hypothetical protein D8674_000942 [Pyrus ussuriensis x Pyrus communis]